MTSYDRQIAARDFFHTMENFFAVFPHNGKQLSAEPKPQAKGEREVYSATRSEASERAKRTERQNVSTLWKTFHGRTIHHKERKEHKEKPPFCDLCG